MNCQKIRMAIDAASPREPFSEFVSHHLAGCQGCSDYAAQMTALFALMSDVPRVQVPNDFDFRLRARIAQARSVQEPRGGLGFFTEFWKLSFSWGQAASAMAAIALVVTLSAVYLVSNNKSVPNTPVNVASAGKNANLPAGPSSVSVAPSMSDNENKSNPVSPLANSGGRRFEKASYHSKANNPKSGGNPGGIDTPTPKGNFPGYQVVVHSPNGSRRVVTVAEVSYGVPATVAMADNTPHVTQAIF
ncbi:MAG TPA: hypothetical protein VFD58_04625 [Blastocatellia bacterium]|nr:hypothetical protein [Blastocatellia bacterium]